MTENQYITKTDLKVFGKELVSEVVNQVVGEVVEELDHRDQKFDKKFDKMKIDLKKDLDNTAAHYYGLIREDLKDAYKANKEWLMDVPEKVSKLSTKSEENDEEHADFRARLRLLEQA